MSQSTSSCKAHVHKDHIFGTTRCSHPASTTCRGLFCLPAAALAGSVWGGEICRLRCILHLQGKRRVEPSCGRLAGSGQLGQVPEGEPWCTGRKTRGWPWQENTSQTFALEWEEYENYTDVETNHLNNLRNRVRFFGQHSLCLAHFLQRQKGMRTPMIKTVPRAIKTMT